MRRALPILALLAFAVDDGARAALPSHPLDCLPDAVATWQAVDSSIRYGAPNVPGIVVGPPGESTPTTGSTTVASLGIGGSMTWRLDDAWIEDRPGADFIVFENVFFQGPPPTAADEPYAVFHEIAFVEVSEDGATWHRFPHDAGALAEASERQTIDGPLRERLGGLAGITPTFTGNWTVPDQLGVFDPAGIGGISGAGGDAFDLADVGLARARFVRLVDTGAGNGFAGAAEGFDVDALVVVHGRPAALAAGVPDADGDGLPDLAEDALYGTRPDLADSDADGTDDGREIAGCRDPLSASAEPSWSGRARLWLRDGACTEAVWTWVGSGAEHDLLRGSLAALAPVGGGVDLGPTTCLASAAIGVRWSCDAEAPSPGEGWFYLVRVRGSGDAAYGRASSLDPRFDDGSCP